MKRTLISLIPVFVLVVLLAFDISIFGSDSILGASQVSLLFSAGVCVLLGSWLLKTPWKAFERAIADFGQSLGVTATGLLLLRTVDPENKTEATAAFGYKQLLHEPFMGGGIVTALALTLVFTIGWVPGRSGWF